MNTSQPLEKVIVNQILHALKAHGVLWCIKTHGGAFQGAGLPDILAIAPVTGRLVGIEVKRPKVGRLTELKKANSPGSRRLGFCSNGRTNSDYAGYRGKHKVCISYDATLSIREYRRKR